MCSISRIRPPKKVLISLVPKPAQDILLCGFCFLGTCFSFYLEHTLVWVVREGPLLFFLFIRESIMLFELLSAGHLTSVAGGFLDSMRSASDNRLLEHIWIAQFFLPPAIDIKKKEGKGVVAQLACYDEGRGIFVPSRCGCRIVLFPISRSKYLMSFGKGCYSTYLSNTTSHPIQIPGGRVFSKDFEVAGEMFKEHLLAQGCVVQIK